MPYTPNGASNPPTTPYLFSVPYPAAPGTAGPQINVGTFLSAGSQVRQGPEVGDYTDAWIEVINYSDSMLALVWDNGPMEPFIPPGQIWSARIPVSAQVLATTIAFQTAAQFFVNEVLTVTFYTAHDIRSGYRPRLGPLVPSVPAAAIGPGPLPAGVTIRPSQLTTGALTEGVTIGADDVTAETFGAGVLLPGAQVTGTVASAATSADLDGIFDAFSASGSGVVVGILDGTAALTVGGTPRGSILRSWDGAGFHRPFGVGSAVGTFGGTQTYVDDTGAFARVGNQPTVGSFGVASIVARNQFITTLTTAGTVLTFAVTVNSFYRISCYVSLNNGTSGNKITLTVSSTDSLFSSASTIPCACVAAGAVAVLNGVTSLANGNYLCFTVTATAKSGTNITVTFQDPTNTPDDVVYAVIERLD